MSFDILSNFSYFRQKFVHFIAESALAEDFTSDSDEKRLRCKFAHLNTYIIVTYRNFIFFCPDIHVIYVLLRFLDLRANEQE